MMGKNENPTTAMQRITHECFDGTVATQMFTVSAAHLRAIQGAHASQDVRNYIQGIYLDLSEPTPWLVATDGHVMARCPVYGLNPSVVDEFIAERRLTKAAGGSPKYGNPDQLIFRLEKRLPPSALTSGELIGVDLRARRAWVVQDESGIGRARSAAKKKSQEWIIEAMEDGRYPDWRRVCLHHGNNFTPARGEFPGYIGLNLLILGKIHEGITKIEPSRPDIRTVSGRQVVSENAVKITLIDARVCDVLVTLMPCRVSG